LAELALAPAEPAQDLVQAWDLAQAPAWVKDLILVQAWDLAQALAWVKDLTGELASGLDSQRTLTSAANQ
jgi:hypothetical protein